MEVVQNTSLTTTQQAALDCMVPVRVIECTDPTYTNKYCDKQTNRHPRVDRQVDRGGKENSAARREGSITGETEEGEEGGKG